MYIVPSDCHVCISAAFTDLYCFAQSLIPDSDHSVAFVRMILRCNPAVLVMRGNQTTNGRLIRSKPDLPARLLLCSMRSVVLTMFHECMFISSMIFQRFRSVLSSGRSEPLDCTVQPAGTHYFKRSELVRFHAQELRRTFQLRHAESKVLTGSRN